MKSGSGSGIFTGAGAVDPSTCTSETTGTAEPAHGVISAIRRGGDGRTTDARNGRRHGHGADGPSHAPGVHGSHSARRT